MYSKINSAVVYGIDGLQVEIEVNISKGLPAYQIVGLPDKTIRESKERVRSALESIGIKFPAKRITLNLIPAEIPKDGSQLDLPMAIGIVSALGEIEKTQLSRIAFFGEMTLDGRLLPVPGILSMVSAVAKHGIQKVVVPKGLENEACMVEGVTCYGANTLQEVFELLKDKKSDKKYKKHSIQSEQRRGDMPDDRIIDFMEVKGQEMAKRALMISAAGFHNILLSGPPGSGKSMMLSAFEGILPEMNQKEAVEVRRIQNLKAQKVTDHLSLKRPFRKPHHQITTVAMIGGGVKPRPGELTLAHRGVLFLDELPEFKRETIEALRQPLEDNNVHLSRLHTRVIMPAKVLLAATMNPCKCGFSNSMDKVCVCSDREIKNYLGKLSGPMIDRIDLLVEVQRTDLQENKGRSISSSFMGEKIDRAVQTQNERFANEDIQFNSEMSGRHIKAYCAMSEEADKLLKSSVESFKLSKRVEDKIIKIARTIADLDQAVQIDVGHIAEAVQYRLAENRMRGAHL